MLVSDTTPSQSKIQSLSYKLISTNLDIMLSVSNTEFIMVLAFFIIMTLACIAVCHQVAKKRGANPVYWGVMGAIFGPLAVPFAFRANSKPPSRQ
ncbi:hypothetical protein AB833_24760 [Chromatiales bacterium (ex Bugula neritina AB1)]|nr:hypothetical protein AB833_24760 [Chromatiales bacterium (ex Bugula neritina AB1)]